MNKRPPKTTPLSGVLPVFQTPFHEDESIDFETLEALGAVFIGEDGAARFADHDLDIDLGSVALRYGHHTGDPALRACIAEQYPGLSSEQIVVTSGASEAIFSLNAAIVSPGSHVVVEHPNYPSLYDIPHSLGCDVSLYRLEYDQGFRPDLEKLDALCRADSTCAADFTDLGERVRDAAADMAALMMQHVRHAQDLLVDAVEEELGEQQVCPGVTRIGGHGALEEVPGPVGVAGFDVPDRHQVEEPRVLWLDLERGARAIQDGRDRQQGHDQETGI